jgi:uncharacterized coiled-coil protein SlyX
LVSRIDITAPTFTITQNWSSAWRRTDLTIDAAQKFEEDISPSAAWLPSGLPESGRYFRMVTDRDERDGGNNIIAPAKPALTDTGWRNSWVNVNTMTINGYYWFCIRDNAGNTSDWVRVVVDFIDKTNPNISVEDTGAIANGKKNWTNATFSVTITPVDVGDFGKPGYNYSTFNGENWVSTDRHSGIWANTAMQVYRLRQTTKITPMQKPPLPGESDAEFAATWGVSGGWMSIVNAASISQNGHYWFWTVDQAENIGDPFGITINRIDRTAPTIFGIQSFNRKNGNESTGLNWTNEAVDLVVTLNADTGTSNLDGTPDGMNEPSLNRENGVQVCVGNPLNEGDWGVYNMGRWVTGLENESWQLGEMNYGEFITSSSHPDFPDTDVRRAVIPVDDNRTYYVRIFDNAGNISQTLSFAVQYIDRTKPTFTNFQVPVESTNTAAIVRMTAADYQSGIGGAPYSWAYSREGEIWVWLDWACENEVYLTENGIYKFRIQDAAGNIAIATVPGLDGENNPITTDKIRIAIIDKTNPTFTVTSDTGWGATNQDLTIRLVDVLDFGDDPPDPEIYGWETYIAGVSEIAANFVCLPGRFIEGQDAGVIPWDTSLFFTITINGWYSFLVRDNVGNVSIQIVEITCIDKTAPEIPAGGITRIYGKYDAADLTLMVLTLNIPGVDSGDLGKTGYYFGVSRPIDRPSGLHDQAYKWTVSNTAPDWDSIADGEFESNWVENLTLPKNGTYYIWARDKAGNVSNSGYLVTGIPTFRASIAKSNANSVGGGSQTVAVSDHSATSIDTASVQEFTAKGADYTTQFTLTFAAGILQDILDFYIKTNDGLISIARVIGLEDETGLDGITRKVLKSEIAASASESSWHEIDGIGKFRAYAANNPWYFEIVKLEFVPSETLGTTFGAECPLSFVVLTSQLFLDSLDNADSRHLILDGQLKGEITDPNLSYEERVAELRDLIERRKNFADMQERDLVQLILAVSPDYSIAALNDMPFSQLIDVLKESYGNWDAAATAILETIDDLERAKLDIAARIDELELVLIPTMRGFIAALNNTIAEHEIEIADNRAIISELETRIGELESNPLIPKSPVYAMVSTLAGRTINTMEGVRLYVEELKSNTLKTISDTEAERAMAVELSNQITNAESVHGIYTALFADLTESVSVFSDVLANPIVLTSAVEKLVDALIRFEKFPNGETPAINSNEILTYINVGLGAASLGLLAIFVLYALGRKKPLKTRR